MKLSIILFVLFCVLTVNVSGATKNRHRRSIHRRRAARTQEQEEKVDAATVSAAYEKHISAVGFFTRAADSALKTAAMQAATHAAASERAFLTGLAAETTDMDKCRELVRVHIDAATSYRELSMGYAAISNIMLAGAMNKAAAEQYEAGAKRAAACGEFLAAAHWYSFAVVAYRDIGDLNKVRSLEAAIARQREIQARSHLVRGQYADAAYAFAVAADACEAAGNPGKARAMNEAAAENYETEAVKHGARNSKLVLSFYYAEAAQLYEKIGCLDRAQSVRDAAGRAMGNDHY